MTGRHPVGLAELQTALRNRQLTPLEAVERACQALQALDSAVISWVPDAVARARHAADRVDLPLGGVPFVLKDNIDLAGTATTAGCPSYSYIAQHSAAVVDRLVAAGAIPVAKANMDQFATGLVGTRSPYGTPVNVFDARRVPGGSSSGSAVAVAAGAAPFALGTDTAGSGRIPAAFNGIVGLKPTRGRLSVRGVVPAVRTVDCVSLFALSVADAWTVLNVAEGFDPADDYSRRPPAPRTLPGPVRIGVSPSCPIEVGALSLAGAPVLTRPVDLEPLLEAGRMLYGGPWLAERYAAVGDFLRTDHEGVDPVVRQIILEGDRYRASEAATAAYQLAHLRRRCDALWDDVDVIVHRTAPCHPTLAEVAGDPIGVNLGLGAFTTYTNLLDLCAAAVPVGLIDGLPEGVSVVGPAWSDNVVAAVAAAIHTSHGGLRGATGVPIAGPPWLPPPGPPAVANLAVAGAHLRGEPLHHQLLDLGVDLVGVATTTADYRLFALAGTDPPKPGLVRVADGSGAKIEVEVYRLPLAAFGQFVAGTVPPMCIGTVRTSLGPVSGFLCEPIALEGSNDVTSYGGWRAYRAVVGR